MKIRTLTTYDVYNYGASLQAYALQAYLVGLGHDVEIINYQPDYLTRKYDYRWVNPESRFSRWAATRFVYRVLKYLQRQTTMGRKRRFDDFNHRVLKETPVRYTSYEQLCVTPPDADLYLVGSDQIWNVFYEAGRDPAFYLEFVREGRRASYAASFSYLDIDDANMRRIASSLRKFDAVSVRESNGLDILRKMNVRGEWVLDPVFLLSVDEWKRQMVPFVKSMPFVLVYDFEMNEQLKSFVKGYAKRHNMAIVSIMDTYPNLYADKNYMSAGPQDFLTLLYNCDAFVSNSFHGTAFSIMFHKPVYVFSRNRHKVNSRMESLLGLFGLKQCMDPTAEAAFDWQQVDSILERERAKSKCFLNNLL